VDFTIPSCDKQDEKEQLQEVAGTKKLQSKGNGQIFNVLFQQNSK
jgi:hypothetical protein